jgi:hypothetical protein
MATEINDQTGAIETVKSTYRAYVTYGTDSESNTIITKIKSQAEASAKSKKTGLAVNWQKAEDEGFEQFSENEFIRYNVKTLAAAQLLVPDEEQFLYIFQCGLNQIQNARCAAIMTARKENTPEPEPEFANQTIDLRIGTDEEGTNSIGQKTIRKSLSDMDKLRKMLTSMGVPPDKQEAMILAMAANGGEDEAEDEEG